MKVDYKICGFKCINKNTKYSFSFDIMYHNENGYICYENDSNYNLDYEISKIKFSEYTIRTKIESTDKFYLQVFCKEINALGPLSDEAFEYDSNSNAYAVFEIHYSEISANGAKLKFLYVESFNGKQKPKIKKGEYYPSIPDGLIENWDNVDEVNAGKGYVENTKLTDKIYTKNSNGDNVAVAWDILSYDFMQGEAPDTVNPILWRMEKLNNLNGLFQVLPEIEIGGKDGLIYQIRTYDLATMTIVKSKSGWIVIDPLGGKETAAAGWVRFKQNVDATAKVCAILITHSHVDHYKGMEGIISSADILNVSQKDFCANPLIPENKVLVVAPNSFYDEAISENLYLGNCMSRRAVYMYGSSLPHDNCGQIGCGLGKTVGTYTGSLIQPSFELEMEEESNFMTLTIDGLIITFQNVPGTEAPAEFHIYLNDYDALCPGENITHTMHNLLTSRGAKVRDPKAFAKAIDNAINKFSNIQVIIGTHHWPTWNEDKNGSINECIEMMKKQRDMYQYFNDQVIRMVNKGMNMEEIAEEFKLPKSLDCEFYNRGYYGTVNHNVKAVMQRYVGWWDGNPANYFKYPETEVAKRFVADMGGEITVLNNAKEYFANGDYRWTVELTKQLVFNNPSCMEARYLEADALEQLAYSFEAGTWRNIFLSAAFELRGIRMGDTLPHTKEQFIENATATLKTLVPEYAFEYLKTLVDVEKVEGLDWICKIKIGETSYLVEICNSVLHYKAGSCSDRSFIFIDMMDFANKFRIYMRHLNGLPNDGLNDDSYNQTLLEFFNSFDTLDGQWNIVEPLAKEYPLQAGGE